MSYLNLAIRLQRLSCFVLRGAPLSLCVLLGACSDLTKVDAPDVTALIRPSGV